MLKRYLLQSRSFSTAAAGKNKVGFIGLGNMGMNMAKNLVKNGYAVQGFDMNAKSLEAAKEANIAPKTSLKEVSQGVDFIVMSLPRTQDCDNVLNQDGGVFDSADKGTLIMDSSTISPMAAEDFSKTALKKELVYIDSPMSGGTGGAAAQTLTFMVGAAKKEYYEQAVPVLEAMGKKVFYCGLPGTGETAKISNNMILGIQMVAVSEGLALGEKLGIDSKLLTEILSVSSSNCWCVNSVNPRPGNIESSPSSKNYEGGFQTALIKKDLALALQLADEVNADVSFARDSVEYYKTLEKAGYGQKDFGYVFQYIMKNKKL